MLAAYHQDHLTGVAATGSNMCLGGDRLFVHTGDRCLGLDVKTGRQVAELTAPPRPDGKPGRWGYIACAGRRPVRLAWPTSEHVVKESWRRICGKLDMTSLLSESVLLFALDAQTGRQQVDLHAPAFHPPQRDRHGAGPRVSDRPAAGRGRHAGERSGEGDRQHPTGRLVCLDARTGKVLWKTADDIFGTLLALSEQHDVLVMSYQPTSFKLDSELGGRLAAFRAQRRHAAVGHRRPSTSRGRSSSAARSMPSRASGTC